MPEKQEPCLNYEDAKMLLAAAMAEHSRYAAPEPEPISPGNQLALSMFSELLYGLRVRGLDGDAPKQLLAVDVEEICGQGKLKLKSRPQAGKRVEVVYAGKDPVKKPIPETGNPPITIDIDNPGLVVAVRVLDTNDHPVLVSFVNNTVTPGVGAAAVEQPTPAYSAEYATPSQAS